MDLSTVAADRIARVFNIPGVARVVATDTLKQGFEREKDENRVYSCVLRCSILAIKMAVRF